MSGNRSEAKIVRCPVCGCTEFFLRKTITVNDRLIIDEETGEARIEVEEADEILDGLVECYHPLHDCDEIVCAGCEEPMPKERFNGIEPKYL